MIKRQSVNSPTRRKRVAQRPPTNRTVTTRKTNTVKKQRSQPSVGTTNTYKTKRAPRRQFQRPPVRHGSRFSKGKLKIIPLGGVEEIGRNMTIFEYENDIVIIDMGLQFPEEDMPGIDYVIPDSTYLNDKAKNIRGVIITHGHFDHIGGIPHLAPKLGNPQFYATPLTSAIIKKRQEDYTDSPPLNINVVDKKDKVQLGKFSVEFFHVNHNIPGGVGVVLRTPVGNIFYTGDFKFDFAPIADEPADIGRIASLANDGALILMSDSTGADSPGHSMSESQIQNNLEEIFKKEEGRIIAATFSSLISRIQEIITIAEKHNRKVAIDGYSMKTNVEIARKLGHIKTKRNTIIPINKANNFPDKNIVVLCTGAQGEGRAVLMRIINNEHRFIKIKPKDTVVFSSSVVPGNERTVQSLKDSIYKRGAKVIHYKMMDVHAGGHAQVEDLKMMINLVKPKFFIPIHGNYYMLKLHTEIAQKLGMPEKNTVIPGNGKIIEATANSLKLTTTKVPTNYVMVDGLGVGDIGQIVLRDRQVMSKDGMFTVIIAIESKTGNIIQEPDIISRGFIYMKESRELVEEARKKIKDVVKQKTKEKPINWTYVRNNLRDILGDFLYQKTQRRPMILPVIIEV